MSDSMPEARMSQNSYNNCMKADIGIDEIMEKLNKNLPLANIIGDITVQQYGHSLGGSI